MAVRTVSTVWTTFLSFYMLDSQSVKENFATIIDPLKKNLTHWIPMPQAKFLYTLIGSAIVHVPLKTGCHRRIGLAWALGVFHHRTTINGIKKKKPTPTQCWVTRFAANLFRLTLNWSHIICNDLTTGFG